MEILVLALVVVAGFFVYNSFVKKPAEKPTPTPAPTPEPVKAVEEVQPVVENKVDPVSVALDLEPVAVAQTAAEPAKKPRKPRAPKAEKPAAKKAAPKKVAAAKSKTTKSKKA